MGTKPRPYIPKEPAVSTFMERYRARRNAARRRDAIERAIAKNPSSALRDELHAMLSRS
ncbi:hypothetical protein GCM10027610_121540 [Dactylosporangium cerinum]